MNSESSKIVHFVAEESCRIDSLLRELITCNSREIAQSNDHKPRYKCQFPELPRPDLQLATSLLDQFLSLVEVRCCDVDVEAFPQSEF
jgi:hypothetical protein